MAALERVGAAPLPSDVAIGPDLEVFGRLASPDVNLAIWRRAAEPGFRHWLDRLPDSWFPRLRVASYPEETPDVLSRALSAEARRAAPLIADIAALARLYGRYVRPTRLVLRLDRIEGDGCRFFHADRVGARLLCTYRGPATEYLADEDVVRRPNGEVVEPPRQAIRRLATFDVGLFRGSLAPHGRPVVHRSPPISGTSVTRWLLAIDDGAHGH